MFTKILMIWAILYSTGILKTEGITNETFINNTLTYSPLQDRGTLVNLIQNCYQNSSFEAINDTSCEGLFDSYLCSQHTDVKCPIFIIGIDPSGNAPLECHDYYYGLHSSADKDGQEHEPKYCMDEAQEMGRHSGKIIAHVVGYSVSVVALICALMFFFCIQTLQSTLGRIQKHVYIAVLINNVLWIIWYITLFYDIRFITGNKILCKVFHVAVNYFLATSYFWLLALCLHLFELVNTLVVYRMWSFLGFRLLGWGGPFLAVALYFTCRYFLEYTDGCWLLQVNSSLVLAISNTIVVTSAFVKVLCLLHKTIDDIHKGTTESTRMASLRAAHAAIFQLLLLGILLLLLPLRANSDLSEENVLWDIFWILLQNSQGLWFAAFLSSSNVEVRAFIRSYFLVFTRSDDNVETRETESSNQPSTSRQAQNPENPENPANPETAEISVISGNPENQTAETAETAEISVISGIPEIPQIPGTPEIPEIIEIPEFTVKPEFPENPDIVETII